MQNLCWFRLMEWQKIRGFGAQNPGRQESNSILPSWLNFCLPGSKIAMTSYLLRVPGSALFTFLENDFAFLGFEQSEKR